MMTMSPGLRVGTSICWTLARKAAPCIGPSSTMGAVRPDRLSAPTTVVVFQWPSRDWSPAPLAVLCPSVKPGHFCRGAGLIDEHRSVRIKIELTDKPGPPSRQHIRPQLLAGVDRFLKLMAWQSSSRHTVLDATRRPWVRSRCSAISASVMSEVASISSSISCACASIRCERLSPPFGWGSRLPVSCH